MYDYLEEWQKRTTIQIDAVLQVGDFGIYHYMQSRTGKVFETDWHKYSTGEYHAPIPTWIVPGNHEGWEELESWLKLPDAIPNMRLLPDGGITNIFGLKVGSVWGNFSPNSWNNPAIIEQVRRHSKSSPKTMHIRKSAVEHLKTLGEFDMLLTHDTSCGMMVESRQPDKNIKVQLGLAPDEKATGCPGFNELYITGKPKSHFFGHFHKYVVCEDGDYQKGKPVVVCLHNFQYNKEQSLWIYQL